ICFAAAVAKCPSLPVRHGELYDHETCTTDTKIYNDTCTVTCTLGYNLTDIDGVRTCTENGTWSNNVMCELVKCPALPVRDGELYDNEKCTTDINIYNDTCTVTCTLGYNMTGIDGVRMCTENGTWSNNVTCELVTCAPIRTTVGEVYEEPCTAEISVYNDTCELSCQVGYNMSGSDGVRKCKEKGTWSNPVTCEEITCEFLREDPKGKYKNHNCTARNSSYDETCELECELGYMRDPDTNQTCQLDGTWSSDTHCVVINCPTLNEVDHARLVAGGDGPFIPENVLQYECTPGYERTGGHLLLLCRKDGQWSGEQPSCTVVSCGPPAPVANTHATMPDETVFMSNITYECKAGYKAMPGGDWTRQCQEDKRWSGTAPICIEIRCGAPPTVANTTVTTDGVRVNDTATYSCLAGYRLRAGNLTKVCNEQEQWQNKDPQCEVIAVAYAEYSTNGGDTVGGKVMYKCVRGFQRVSGSGFSRCTLKGEWTKPSLICAEVTCGMPPPVKNADVTTTCVTRGCVAEYRCYVGYEGQTQRSQCTVDGKWSRVSINCTRTL
ncbi:hypothetical protein NP493_2875g00011, partial [Ridgeia piscesae]